MLVIATPDTFDVRQMVRTARELNPDIEIVLRTESEEDAKLLEQAAAGKVFLGENELAIGMARHVLEKLGN
jgi:monovalent cation:H+ antiporter-2, CPA2 family